MADTIESARGGELTIPMTTDDSPPGQSAVLIDVWSRTSSKYRIRSIVLLGVNVLLFAAVGCFAFWLRSGEFFAPTMDGYLDQIAQAFNFRGRATVTLASFLMKPISVQQVPMQIPIVGLLMAALIAIPILVAILYRFWSAIPFVAVVGFLAVMPWLAITLFGSCIIASVRPFRSRFRFMSALLGLVPTVVYLVLAWKGSAEVLASVVDPIDRIKFVAPWALAIVAATVVFAIVLALAKLVDYRPGAITPLLAVMFGLPVALFEFHVGRDELHYRILEGLNDEWFADVNASLSLDQAVRQKWERHPWPRPSLEKLRAIEEIMWQFELAADMGPRQSELTRHQCDLVRRCEAFHHDFPDSRYTPNALFIKARALDTRVDVGEFRRTKWVRFYSDFPNAASRSTWRIIAENGSNSVLGAVALLRLAQLDVRDADIDRAKAKLATLLERFDRPRDSGRPTPSNAGMLGGVLNRDAPESSLEIEFDRILLEAHRLHDLLAENNDPIYRYDPFSRPRDRDHPLWFGLATLDPRSESYIANLQALIEAYPNAQLLDNLELDIARATSSLSLRIERLEACLLRYPRRDAVPEALFRLGLAYRDAGRATDSHNAFLKLVSEHPDSIWSEHARRFGHGPPDDRSSDAT